MQRRRKLLHRPQTHLTYPRSETGASHRLHDTGKSSIRGGFAFCMLLCRYLFRRGKYFAAHLARPGFQIEISSRLPSFRVAFSRPPPSSSSSSSQTYIRLPIPPVWHPISLPYLTAPLLQPPSHSAACSSSYLLHSAALARQTVLYQRST